MGQRSRAELGLAGMGFRASRDEFLDQLACYAQISRSCCYSGRPLQELSTGMHKAAILDQGEGFLWDLPTLSVKSTAGPVDLIRLLTRLSTKACQIRGEASIPIILHACLDSSSRVNQDPVIFTLRLRTLCSFAPLSSRRPRDKAAISIAKDDN